MSKLVLIDGNAILHRAYHALPPLTTRVGEPINAVYGLISMLLRIIQDLKPTHIAVCFDRPEPTFRNKLFKKYQSQRPEMDKELSGQFEKAKKTLTAMNIPIYEKAGYEADDLIGTIAFQLTNNLKPKTNNKSSVIGYKLINEVIIVTGDRDILQLVDDKKGIKVYLPKKGLSDAQLMGTEEVKEKMGVGPDRIVDYKALVGDPSDNYNGVPGVGPKTAIDLINKFGSYENIMKDLDNVGKTTKEKIEKGKESAEISYKLARIVDDVPIDFNLEEMSKWNVGSDKVIDLFSEFGFRTLTKRVKEVGEKIENEKQMKLL